MSLVALFPLPGVLAGMPSLTLTDLAEMRVQSISFFLALLFVSAWGIKLLWNGLRRDFQRLPWLSYRRALSLVTLWGFLFILVLTMISGARELMTPGAWEKDGLTYKLKNPAELEDARRSGMAELKVALWSYADAHDGQLPKTQDDPAIAAEAWESPDITAAPYVYLGGHRIGQGHEVVAYEPAIFPGPRLVLLSDGTIQPMHEAELGALLPETGGAP